VLPEAVARSIAAGEVIERPHSVVRELLDNSIDAGATNIRVELERGGLERVRVVDDGVGMAPDDLRICWKPHATSKVRSQEDLEHVATLGFRGEALSSIAQVARLEIRAAGAHGPGHRLLVETGEEREFSADQCPPGTVVDVQRLFHAMPARKRFLKSPGAESSLCRAVLIEKALPHTSVSFRLIVDGALRLFLPADQLRNRVSAAFDELRPDLLYEARDERPESSVTALIADPSFARNDRKRMQVFVNRRAIREFGFIQAVEYALGDLFPGGRKPVAFVFMEVEPSLVDFNVHPAKREARFRSLDRLRHQLVALLRDGVPRPFGATTEASTSNTSRSGGSASESAHNSPNSPDSALGVTPQRGRSSHAPYSSAAPSSRCWGSKPDVTEPNGGRPSSGISGARYLADFDLISEAPAERPAGERTGTQAPGMSGTGERKTASPVSGDERTSTGEERFRFYGTLFGLFLLCSYDDALYIIDQHAAHERILYNRFTAGSPSQPLLVPIHVDLDPIQRRQVHEHRSELTRYGINIEHAGPESVQITAVPQVFRGTERTIVEALTNLKMESGELARDLFASVSCRAAVMDGDYLDDALAGNLALEALQLPVPRCPHGRPVWHRIARDELFRLMQRM